MINVYDILETIRMIQDECLDIRTITMGISLMDCIDSDIDKAVKEAEQFAAEDKKKREAVDLRNNADQMVYQTEKLLSENGDKFSDDDKSALNTKLDALKEALKGDNTDAIKSAEEDLTNKFYEVSQMI